MVEMCVICYIKTAQSLGVHVPFILVSIRSI